MKKVIISALVLTAIGTHANAQSNTAQQDAAAKIVSAITISSDRELNFGSIAPGTGGTVTIAAASGSARGKTGAVTYTNAGYSSARFSVQGEASSTYSISVTNPSVTLVSGANSMSASLLVSAGGTNAATSTGTLSGSGSQLIYVGGTLTVGNNQANGEYLAENAIEIMVAYN